VRFIDDSSRQLLARRDKDEGSKLETDLRQPLPIFSHQFCLSLCGNSFFLVYLSDYLNNRNVTLAHALHEVQVEIGNDMGEYELIYRQRMPANPPSSSEAASAHGQSGDRLVGIDSKAIETIFLGTVSKESPQPTRFIITLKVVCTQFNVQFMVRSPLDSRSCDDSLRQWWSYQCLSTFYSLLF